MKNSIDTEIFLKSGFTLIEIAVVLVIIGLIVGGILVGQDLIKAAEIQGTIKQLEQYKTATNTFKIKYGQLPGDISPQDAANYGLFQLSPGVGGDENGILGPEQLCTGEVLVFWRHLSEAQLIEGAYGTQGNNALDPATGSPVADPVDPTKLTPQAKLGKNVFFYINGVDFGFWNYTNFFMLDNWQALGSGYCSNGNNALTPLQAYAIDNKIDDGIPNSGQVASASNINATASAGICIVSADYSGPNTFYNLNPATGADVPSCSLAAKAGF